MIYLRQPEDHLGHQPYRFPGCRHLQKVQAPQAPVLQEAPAVRGVPAVREAQEAPAEGWGRGGWGVGDVGTVAD